MRVAPPLPVDVAGAKPTVASNGVTTRYVAVGSSVPREPASEDDAKMTPSDVADR